MLKLKVVKDDYIEYRTVVKAFSGYEILSFTHTVRNATTISLPVNTMHATVNGVIKLNKKIKEVTNVN